MGKMTWFASLCKSLGVLAPFITGLGTAGGLLFKVWQYKTKGSKSPERDGREMYQAPVENPDLIMVCSKLDTLESQQSMLMDMNSTLTEMVRSISSRLDAMDTRITNIDTRLTHFEERN